MEMNPTGHTVEVKNLSPDATDEDVRKFFAFCGAIQHVEIIRANGNASTAYVGFRNPHAVETAILLTGASILDQPVSITYWGYYEGERNIGIHSSWKIEDDDSPMHSEGHTAIPSVSLAQSAVQKGYMLGKGALSKAKAFDESHQVSATAVAKVTDLSDKLGLTDKIFAGVETARSVNQRYHIMDTTKSAVSATGRTALSAANSVASSSYFSKGALWLSGALNRASQVAADLGSRGASK